MQSFNERFCTLYYELEDYAEGIAKYPNCADQFSVNFTVTLNADMSYMTTDAVAQCNITNLERCKVYDIFARSYRGGQVLDLVHDVGSVMTSKYGKLQTMHGPPNNALRFDLEVRLTSQNFLKQIKQFPNLLQKRNKVDTSKSVYACVLHVHACR